MTASDAMGGSLAEARVDLEAIAHNTRLLAAAGNPAALMAVVKADGFGHGAVPVTETVLRHGASWIGVTSAAEALALRAAGIEAPMLMWMHAPGDDLVPVLRAGVDVSVASLEQLAALAEAAAGAGLVARLHLKVDTGLSRGGAPIAEWSELFTWARKYEQAGSIDVHGIWSHLAKAELAADASVPSQSELFARARAGAHAAGLRPRLHHLANSAAILQIPASHGRLTRAGIGLYGVEPVPGRVFGLRPAMTLRARVILVKRVPAGTGVSYGHDYVSERETTLALVPIGFADGVPRSAGPHASVLINGRRCPVAGRIAMDQFVVDVGDLPVAAGDVAVVFGPGDDGEPLATDWAGWAGTIAHEVLTGVGARVPRRYEPDRAPTRPEDTSHLMEEKTDERAGEPDPRGRPVRGAQR
jgi:alanine racemase